MKLSEPSSAAEIDEAAEIADGEVVDDDELPRPGAGMVQAVQTLSEHEGPLPSKEWFAAVESLAPGTTKELVADYVSEREHQRAIQRKAVEIDRENFQGFAKYQNRQLLAASTVVLTIAAGGIVLIAVGHSIAGLIYLVAELAILAGVFLGRQALEGRARPPQLPGPPPDAPTGQAQPLDERAGGHPTARRSGGYSAKQNSFK